MKPIKFIKQKKNHLDFEVMTLINIVSKGNRFYYFFICEYDVKHNDIITKEYDIIEFNEEDYMDIELNYKISLN